MRIRVPLTYRIHATPYKCRIPEWMSMLENLWVDVPEAGRDEIDLALVIRNLEGDVVENVYACRGGLWVRDSRQADEPPLTAQHLHSVGHKVFKHPGREKDYVADVGKASRVLSTYGMLCASLGKFSTLERAAYFDHEGIGFVERTAESARPRNITESERAAKVAETIHKVDNNVIAVDGKLYFKVQEPGLVATRGYGGWSFSWAFGRRNYANSDPRSLESDTYPVSVLDFARLGEWFGSDEKPLNIDFDLQILLPACFSLKDDRRALLADATRETRDILFAGRMSTESIYAWCAVRDCIKDLLLDEYGRPVSMACVLDLPDDRFEELSSALERYATLDGKTFKSVEMWDSRQIAFDAQPQAITPCAVGASSAL